MANGFQRAGFQHPGFQTGGPPVLPPIGGGGPGTGSGGSGGGLWREGGKKHDVCLEDFEIFIRLAKKRPGQSIQHILRELDEKGPQPAKPLAHIEVRYVCLTREHPNFRPIRSDPRWLPLPPKPYDPEDDDTELLLIMLSVL